MKYNYAFKTEKENLVKAVGRDLSISTKQAIEICSFIRKMPLQKAKSVLEKVEKKQVPVPFRRFTQGAGHKKGMAAGKYPVSASKQILRVLRTLEANAQNKGLSSDLRIIHACAQKAATPFHYGRKRRIKMKRTHVELVAEEIGYVRKEVKKEKQKAVQKAEETRKELKKQETIIQKTVTQKEIEEKNKQEKKMGKEEEPKKSFGSRHKESRG